MTTPDEIVAMELARLSAAFVSQLPEQVQAVAQKYFSDTGLTVAELVPQPIDSERPARAGGGSHAH